MIDLHYYATTLLGAVGSKDSAQHVADLTERRAGVDSVDEERHEILAARGCGPHVAQTPLDGLRVARRAQRA